MKYVQSWGSGGVPPGFWCDVVCVPRFCGLVQFLAVRGRCLRYIMYLLCHSFPKVSLHNGSPHTVLLLLMTVMLGSQVHCRSVLFVTVDL